MSRSLDNMFVILCGPPFCGKSVVSDLVFDDTALIRPSDWMPENFESLKPDLVKDYRITCWKLAIEKTEEALQESPDLVVLDQGNNKFNTIRDLISVARDNGHTIALLYVNSTFALCRKRSGDNWIGDDAWRVCLGNIKMSLPKYRDACDKFVVVDNNDSLDVLASEISSIRSKLCLDTSTHSHMTSI